MRKWLISLTSMKEKGRMGNKEVGMVDSTHPTHFRILGVNWMRSRTLLFRCAVGSVVFHLVLMMLHAVPKGQNVWDSITIENLLAPEVFSVHHTKQIRLQNQYVGTVSMLCHPNKAGDVQHPDLPSCQFDHSWLSCNITGPKVIHSRPWMHHTLSSHKLILFYGTHSEGQESIQAFASQEAHGPFEHLNLSLPFTKYTSVRSLSIFVDDDKQRLYMSIFGHHHDGGKRNLQSSHVLTSSNGVTWVHVVQKKGQNHSFAAAASAAHTDTISLEDISYLSTLIGFDGWLYALGKTQDGKTGSVILCRTQSHTGPIEKGPLLAKGMQHCEMHLVGNMAFVFYTLLGDTLERIFLATLELDSKVDWKQWSLLPGPTVLTPTHNIEQNASFISSKEGCRYSGSVEFNDPYLLRDDDEPDGHFRGTLFYAVQGMRAFAASRVDIQLKELFHYTCFRQKQLIADRIIEASSLAVDGYHKEMTNVIISPVLFTGTGRSGTTFLCKIFQVVGLNISHDNDIDCGHYPGTDGAASWFDAFVTEFHGKRRMYREVLHIVRNPIKVIASRVHRLEGNMSYVKGFHRLTSPWENTSDLVHIIESENYYTDRRDDAMKFSLKHWVRRNSFVGVVASWVEQIEQLSSDPMALWRLCMAAHFGPRCQTLEQWRQAMDNTSQTINTDMDKFKFANKEKRKVDWLELLRLEQMYSSIALKMSLDLGYEIPHEILPDYPYISELQYQCGFDQHGKWDCWY